MGQAERKRLRIEQLVERRRLIRQQLEDQERAQVVAKRQRRRSAIASVFLAAGSLAIVCGVLLWALPVLISGSYGESGAASFRIQPVNPARFATLYGDQFGVGFSEDDVWELQRQPEVHLEQDFVAADHGQFDPGKPAHDFDLSVSFSSGIVSYRVLQSIALPTTSQDPTKRWWTTWGQWVKVPEADSLKAITVPAYPLSEKPYDNWRPIHLGVEAVFRAPVTSAQVDHDNLWTQTWTFHYKPPPSPTSWHMVQTDGVDSWPDVDPQGVTHYDSSGAIGVLFCKKCQLVRGHHGLEESSPGVFWLTNPVMQATEFSVDTLWRPFGWTSVPLAEISAPGVAAVLTAIWVFYGRQLKERIVAPLAARIVNGGSDNSDS